MGVALQGTWGILRGKSKPNRFGNTLSSPDFNLSRRIVSKLSHIKALDVRHPKVT
jgi:hypothetical protein